jgi:hypothetical protein
MNAKQKICVVALGAVVIGVSYWTGYVHGSSALSRQEMFFSIVLPIIIIWTLAKLTFALFFRPDSSPPGGASQSPPPPWPPGTPPDTGAPVPRPPGAPPDVRCGHAAVVP